MTSAPMIRMAVPGDAQRLAAIAVAAYAKYVPRIGREPMPMRADFPAAIAAGHVVVIEHAGAIQGYLVAWAEPDAYFLDNIAVDPAHAGTGLGRALIGHAAAEARRRRLPALRLHTHVKMTENIAIYGHLGFVETHRGIENGFHRVHMWREL
ncbi:MAG: GNAT family N-acetyltransferase [Xanthobacteraceae bacterium]